MLLRRRFGVGAAALGAALTAATIVFVATEGTAGGQATDAAGVVAGGSPQNIFGTAPWFVGMGGTSVAAGAQNERQAQTPLPRGTLRRFTVDAFSNSGGTPTFPDVTFTVRRNGADTAVGCTVPGASFPAYPGMTSCADASHRVTFAAGDEISIGITWNGTSNNAFFMTWSAEYASH